MKPAGKLSYCTLFAFLTLSISSFALTKGFYLEVPYLHQVENYCGPAALAMVLRFWDRCVDQLELAGHFHPFPRKGLSGAQLKELAARYGFSAYSFSGRSETVREHLEKGRPLIVALSPAASAGFNHFVVLVGWDASKRAWIVHDPAEGPYQRRSAKQLAGQWDRLQNWTLLLVPESPK